MLPELLLRRLADARPRQHAELLATLGTTRAELAAALAALRHSGLDFSDVGSDASRLAEPIRWLEPDAILAGLAPAAVRRIERLECLFEIDSTNRYLLDRAVPEHGRAAVAFAEYQHGGRGRNGRRWSMPPGAGIAMSAAWQFRVPPADLSALSLAVGAAARRAIADAAQLDVGLKWPNDLFADGRKLGGILVELGQLPGGATHVVAGIGINVGLSASFLDLVGNHRHQARNIANGQAAPVDRSRLAGSLVGHLVELFVDYSERGFEPYREEWLEAHVLNDQRVEIESRSGVECGRVTGIGADGALIVEDDSGHERRVVSADVSVRASG